MNRMQEHLQWCKDRALALLDVGETAEAIASMISDMRKEAATGDLLTRRALAEGISASRDRWDVRQWIEGFQLPER